MGLDMFLFDADTLRAIAGTNRLKPAAKRRIVMGQNLDILVAARRLAL